jgi:hypothetical protein
MPKISMGVKGKSERFRPKGQGAGQGEAKKTGAKSAEAAEVGFGKEAEVRVKERSGGLIVTLAEEIGFADSLVGKGRLKGEGRGADQQGADENGKAGSKRWGHGKHLTIHETRK